MGENICGGKQSYPRPVQCRKKSKQTSQRRHAKKLSNLGILLPKFHNQLNTVFNYSQYVLSKREEFLLSFGLDFCLPNFKPNFCQFFLPIEVLFQRIKRLELCRNLSQLQNELMVIAHNTFSNLKTNWGPFFNKCDLQLLKSLSQRDDIVVLRPDKGRGVVILGKDDYTNKMNDILNDQSKFRNIGQPNFQEIFKVEDRINRFLRTLKRDGIISEHTYEDLFCSGSSFGILYGLPKIHKQGIPLRPILASFNSPNYKLAKFLVPLLEPLTRNQYTLKNSEDFKIRILSQDSDLYMSSLDVESLFTNVPVRETINIILGKLFPLPDSIYCNFNIDSFRSLLELAVLDTAFVINNNLY